MIKIDEEFQALIPPLTIEEYQGLEQSIIAEGCRDALVCWDNTIVDGHNRYKICIDNNISFKITEISFDSLDDAKEWIILNQFNRRNLLAYDRSILALKLKPIYAEKAKENLKIGAEITNTGLPISVKALNTQSELAKLAGVGHDTMNKVEKIEAEALEEVKMKLRTGETTINQAYQTIRREEKRQEIVTLPPQPLDGLYDVILADPPWQYDFAPTESRAISNNYPTMGLDEIKAVEIPVAENAVLFLWATAPKLQEALEVMQSWGFIYKTNAIWDKEIIGMGYWFRGQHELLLVGTKGNFAPPAAEDRESSVYHEKRTQHSKKPMHYYELIEKAFPNKRYLELFARQKFNDLWAVWGNQID